MITLPASPAPSRAVPALMDFGAVLRPGTGAGVLRIDRMGSRFRWDFEWPPMTQATARLFRAKLLMAREEGLRLPVPLMGIAQGLPGSPVVDGAGQAGKSLDLRGFAAGYVAREGYWLSIRDTAGQHYLHTVTATTVANGSGALANLPIFPALRVPFADGNAVLFDAPVVEGVVTSDVSWELTPGGLVQFAVTIEEAA